MNGVKVSLKDAQKAKEFLIKKGYMDDGKLVIKDKDNIYFPVNKKYKLKKFELVDKKFNTKDKKIRNLKEAVEGNLTKKEKDFLRTAYDIVGEVAILEIEKELEKKEKFLAEAVMKINPRIKTVLKKVGGHIGVFRKQKMKLLAGKDTREAVQKENGINIKVNVETVYFSARLSSERKRIAEQIKKEEKVLVMFSGAAPYVCVIAKNTKAKEIVGVEINPEGHMYGLENLKLNKIDNAKLYVGDVKKVVPKLDEKFDRIIMPLPKTADEFLDCALSVSKKGTIIHFYDFIEEKNIPEESVKKIQSACKNKKMKCRILDCVKCGQNSPRSFRVCVDFKIE